MSDIAKFIDENLDNIITFFGNVIKELETIWISIPNAVKMMATEFKNIIKIIFFRFKLRMVTDITDDMKDTNKYKNLWNILRDKITEDIKIDATYTESSSKDITNNNIRFIVKYAKTDNQKRFVRDLRNALKNQDKQKFVFLCINANKDNDLIPILNKLLEFK